MLTQPILVCGCQTCYWTEEQPAPLPPLLCRHPLAPADVVRATRRPADYCPRYRVRQLSDDISARIKVALST